MRCWPWARPDSYGPRRMLSEISFQKRHAGERLRVRANAQSQRPSPAATAAGRVRRWRRTDSTHRTGLPKKTFARLLNQSNCVLHCQISYNEVYPHEENGINCPRLRMDIVNCGKMRRSGRIIVKIKENREELIHVRYQKNPC